jgi:fucose permease
MATLLLLVIYAAFISLGLPDALLGVAWPIMQVEYSVPVGFAGLISMTTSVNTIISSLLSGRILKRFGTGQVTFASVLITAVALVGIAFAPSFIWLIVLAFPLGLGAGSVDAGLNDYVAKNYEARHMSWLHCFWGIGATSGPIIISQIITYGASWRSGYMSVAVVQFALVVVLFLTLPIWDKVMRLRRAGMPDRTAPEVAVEPKAPTRRTPLDAARSIFYPLQIAGVRPVLIVFLFYCGIESTMGLWGSTFLIQMKGIDVATAAGWVSLFYGSITLGRFITGFVTMRLSSKTIIRLGEVSILLGVVCLLLPLPSAFSMVSLVLIGLGCAPIFPTMLHETPNRFGDEDAQNIMGFQMAVAYIGASLLPPLFGALASATTFAIFPFFFLISITLMLLNSEQINRYMGKRETRV